MFLLALPLTLVHHTLTYLYPLYASYKAISHHHSASPHGVTRSVTGEQRTELAELETWLMYWSVVGAMQIVEGWGEWAWSWLPFYYLAKLAFTLWLVLPQTRGATLLYTAYLGPFLQTHEGDIDVALASARRRASEVAGRWITDIWQQARSAIMGAAMASDGWHPSSSAAEAGPTQTPPTLHNPASGSTSQLVSLLKHYGPLAAAGLVRAMDKAAAQAAHATGTQPPAQAKTPDAAKSTALGAATGTDIPATRSRSSFARPAADDTSLPSSRTASRLAPPSLGTARDPPSSEWSEDEDAEVGAEDRDRRRRTRTTPKHDLSGSYQLVEGNELLLTDASEGNKETMVKPTASADKGWTAWLAGR